MTHAGLDAVHGASGDPGPAFRVSPIGNFNATHCFLTNEREVGAPANQNSGRATPQRGPRGMTSIADGRAATVSSAQNTETAAASTKEP